MGISIVFIFSAAILYTFAVFKERHKKFLTRSLVVLFAGGFLSDLIGTSIMFIAAKVKFALVIHSMCGYAALFIMLAHLIFALLAINKIRNFEKYFTKGSIYAWIVWMIAFISGVPKIGGLLQDWLF